MSRATAAVRFADGTVKWCLYNGTSDILIPGLFDNPESPWDAYYDRNGLGQNDCWPERNAAEEAEPVAIYSDYGGGWWWEGTASRRTVLGPLDPWEEGVEHHDGTPDWYGEAYQRDSTENPQ